jgi:chromosome segregation ATPase
MNRRLQYLNLAGVVALAAVCAVQWQRDRRLNLEIGRLEKTRLAHEQKIAEQEKIARGQADDLVHFKEQLKLAQTDLTGTRQKLLAAEKENGQLLGERDQLKESVVAWSKAVDERDERLKEGNERILELAERLNASVRKFNELASHYNGVVKDLNDLRLKGRPKPGGASE